MHVRRGRSSRECSWSWERQSATSLVLLSLLACVGGVRDRLASAVYMGDLDHVLILLDQWNDGIEMVAQSPVDINRRDERGRSALMMCGTDPQEDHEATNKACGEIGRLLIKAGADVDALDEKRWSVAAYAATLGWDAVVEQLAKAGADLSTADESGATPLIKAALQGRHRAVEALLKAGVPCSQRGPPPESWPAMFYATRNSHAQIDTAWLRTVGVFLDYGCDVNDRDSLGRTALMIAASVNASSAVRFLLDNGADSAAKDNNGHSAASVSAHDEISRMLRDHLVASAETAHEAWLASTDLRDKVGPKKRHKARREAREAGADGNPKDDNIMKSESRRVASDGHSSEL